MVAGATRAGVALAAGEGGAGTEAEAGTGATVAVASGTGWATISSMRSTSTGDTIGVGTVIVADVYAAGEAPMPGVDAEALVAGLRDRGHRQAAVVADAAALADELAGEIRAGDQVICLGAGDITKWAAGLAAAITAQRR